MVRQLKPPNHFAHTYHGWVAAAVNAELQQLLPPMLVAVVVAAVKQMVAVEAVHHALHNELVPHYAAAVVVGS